MCLSKMITQPMGYQQARKNKTKTSKNYQKELPIYHLPQTFNKIRENAREGCIFLSMANKPQNVHKTGQPTDTHTPVNSPNLTGPETERCSSRQLLLLFLPHPESETRLVVVLPGALQQIPPHETLISMNPRRIGCPSSSSYPVSGPCFLLSSTISWSRRSFALTTLDCR